jgi:hypothetical protein
MWEDILIRLPSNVGIVHEQMIEPILIRIPDCLVSR